MREAELMAHDRWSRDDLVAFQRERVRALITHAVTIRRITGKRSVPTRRIGRSPNCPPAEEQDDGRV